MTDIRLEARAVFQKNLNRYMEQQGIDQAYIVSKLGITASTVSDWVNGKKYPRVDAMQKLSDLLGVRMAELTDDVETLSLPNYPDILQIKTKKIPLLGDIAAGVPVYAPEDYDAYVLADNGLHADFALRVQGNSMSPNFKDKDIVFVREQPDVYDGQVAAVVIDDEATLKRVYHVRGGLQLVSYNTDYLPMLFTEENSNSLRVLGLVVGLYRSV